MLAQSLLLYYVTNYLQGNTTGISRMFHQQDIIAEADRTNERTSPVGQHRLGHVTASRDDVHECPYR